MSRSSLNCWISPFLSHSLFKAASGDKTPSSIPLTEVKTKLTMSLVCKRFVETSWEASPAPPGFSFLLRQNGTSSK